MSFIYLSKFLCMNMPGNNIKKAKVFQIVSVRKNHIIYLSPWHYQIFTTYNRLHRHFKLNVLKQRSTHKESIIAATAPPVAEIRIQSKSQVTIKATTSRTSQSCCTIQANSIPLPCTRFSLN